MASFGGESNDRHSSDKKNFLFEILIEARYICFFFLASLIDLFETKFRVN